MKKQLLILLVAVLVTAGLSFGIGRWSAGTPDAVVLVAANNTYAEGPCSAYAKTNETYDVAWLVKGQRGGICVKPDSACARTAYPGGPIPKTCRDQNE